MPRNSGYVYVSRNRVERPVFRARTESTASKPDTPPSTSPAPPMPAAPIPVAPVPIPPLGASHQQQHQQQSPPPNLNPPPGVPPPPPPRTPSPEVNRNYHSSADAYSHGRLPLEPPWSRKDDHYWEASSGPILLNFSAGDGKDNISPGSTASEKTTAILEDKPKPPSPPSEAPAKPAIKKRNTLKKGVSLFSRKNSQHSVLA